MTEAIALDPKNTTFYNERAKLLFNLGKTTESLADFQQVKEILAGNFSVSEQQAAIDKKMRFASLIDYLKWILTGQSII